VKQPNKEGNAIRLNRPDGQGINRLTPIFLKNFEHFHFSINPIWPKAQGNPGRLPGKKTP
jgi:hypothetical protein